MIKYLLRLLISSITFVAVMLIANLAIAQDNSAIALTSTEVIPNAPEIPTVVNLNVISPELDAIAQSNQKQTLDNHFGCSCEMCAQGIKSAIKHI